MRCSLAINGCAGFEVVPLVPRHRMQRACPCGAAVARTLGWARGSARSTVRWARLVGWIGGPFGFGDGLLIYHIR
jgi:hypothetical protein